MVVGTKAAKMLRKAFNMAKILIMYELEAMLHVLTHTNTHTHNVCVSVCCDQSAYAYQ